jgi:hypothetical protein
LALMAFVPDQPVGGFVPDEPSPAAQTALRLARGLIRGGPLGLATEGTQMGMEGLEKASAIAGGAATDVLAQASGRRSVLNPLALEIPPEVAGAVGAVTKTAIPAVVGGIPGKAVGQPMATAAARRVMQSALKPTSKAIANKDAAKAIQTMLDEGVNATPGGAVKLRLLITKLKGDVAKAISESPGAMVDKAHVYRELHQTLDEVSKLGRPNASREAVRQAWETFKNHPLAKGEQIPVGLADEMKRATQRAVKDAYGRLTTTPVDDKIDMAIAAGLRKGVEEAVPSVAPMNAKLSQYINALHQIEPKAAVQANKDLGGLVPLAPTPEAAMVMLADRNPWMKSLIARVLYAGRRTIPTGAGAVTATTATQGGE